jgi:undecaprenyl-diphosphatase
LTAFLPVSSDAQIRLCAALVFQRDPGAAFTAVIQLGPTLAVILYFWKDIVAALTGWSASLKGGDKNSPEAKLGWGVLYGTIPILILGFALQKKIETEFRSLYWIAGSLILVGFVMLAADRKVHEKRTVADVEVKDGIVVGLWQCLALIPGASRSGSTIAGALFAGFTREAAARFSFLLSIPSFIAAGLFEAVKYHKELVGTILPPLAVALVVSFFVGYACIHWFLRYLQKHGIAPFVAYRVVLGVVILYLVQSGQVLPDAGAKKIESPVAASSTQADRKVGSLP